MGYRKIEVWVAVVLALLLPILAQAESPIVPD